MFQTNLQAILKHKKMASAKIKLTQRSNKSHPVMKMASKKESFLINSTICCLAWILAAFR